MQIQSTGAQASQRPGVPQPIQRAFHAKATLAVDDAELRLNDDLSADLRVGFAQPGQAYRTKVRFSNAAGSGKPDFAPDLRGIALRIQVDDSTSAICWPPTFPFRTPGMPVSSWSSRRPTAGGPISMILGLRTPGGTVRNPRDRPHAGQRTRTARKQPVDSVATQTYWSRGALTWGPELAVRYLLRPAPGAPQGPKPSKTDPDYLSTEAAHRLRSDDIRFELCIQRYVNDQVTPIEDTAVEWKETHSPVEPIATLTIRQTDITSTDAQARRGRDRQPRLQSVEHHRGLPPAGQPQPRPQGSLRRQRGTPKPNPLADRNTVTQRVASARLARGAFWVVNPRIPVVSAAAAFRSAQPRRLPPRTADGTSSTPSHMTRHRRPRPVPPPIPEDVRVARTADGSYNDLSAPEMGAVGARSDAISSRLPSRSVR